MLHLVRSNQMVRNYNSSDSEEERHDKFRCERVLSSSGKQISDNISRNKFGRSRSRDRDRFPSSRNDRRDRRDIDFRGSRERFKHHSPEVKRYCLVCNHSQGNCRCHSRHGHRDRLSSERKHKLKDPIVDRKKPSRQDPKHDDNTDSRKQMKRKSAEYDLKEVNHKTENSKKNKRSEVDSNIKTTDHNTTSDINTILQDDLITLDTYSGSSSENEAEIIQKDVFGPALPPRPESTVKIKKQSPEPVKKEKKCKKKTVNKSENKPDVSKGCVKVSGEVIEIRHSESDTEDALSSCNYGPKLPAKLLVKNSSEERQAKEVKEGRHKKRSGERMKGEEQSRQKPRAVEAEQTSGTGFVGKEQWLGGRDAVELSDDERDDTTEAARMRGAYGPSLPPAVAVDSPDHLSDDEIGPAAPGADLSPAQLALQHRAALLKLHMDNKVNERDAPRREEWMTELPENRRLALGLTARGFRSRDAPSQDSTWTESPSEKQIRLASKQPSKDCKKSDKEELDMRIRAERDRKMESAATNASKHRSKSLLEMHQDKLKKKKKTEGPKERRPFSRETDLQTNLLSDAHKKAIYKKAQHLNTRFSSGDSKYL